MRTRPLLTAFLFAAIAAQSWATTYRWVDADGKVHYGDSMPARQSGLGHQELDKQGRVIRDQPRTLFSPEERLRREEEVRLRAELQRQVEQQQRHDRALLLTYADVSEIELARDRAMELEKLTLTGLQSRLNSRASRLSSANIQLAQFRAARVPEPANLIQFRDEAQVELTQIVEAMRQREKIMDELRQRFEADKARFLELQSLRARPR
jgi:hypothetical protein